MTMKTLLILTSLLANLNAFADCRNLISQGKDSVAYRFYIDHDLREQSEKLEMAIMIIQKVMHTAGCTSEEIKQLTFKNKSCHYINSNSRYSYACFLEALEGYYFITQDSLSNINVVYNRWD
jgi:hypothetical protein